MFQVDGVQQSPLEVLVIKDGKELRIGQVVLRNYLFPFAHTSIRALLFQEVNLNLQGDAVSLSVINPRREKSGIYKVILRNAQGQDETDIEVNIMGEED